MKNLIFLIFITLIATGCIRQKKYTEILVFNDFVSLVKDDEDVLYFRTKNSGDCTGYFYSNKADFKTANDRPEHGLSNILDINSIRLLEKNQNHYYFEDQNNIYLVSVHICDNVISYEQRLK